MSKEGLPSCWGCPTISPIAAGRAMAFRFRKSKSLFPGARLNLSKKGASVRLGPKGLGLTMGSSGTRASAGVPGTGVHYSKQIGKRRTSQGSIWPGLIGVVVVIIILAVVFS